MLFFLFNDKVFNLVLIARDVTDLVEKRRTITELSNKGLLTGVFNRKYFEGYFQKVNNVFPTTLMMVDAIMRSLKEKNVREKVHSEQVAVISSKIAKAMGFKSQEIKEVELSGLLHDIGKIGIPEDILNKQGALTDEEYQVIQTHPEIGYQILKSVDEYSLIANEALAHHERYDGKGYPLGISGENIPLTARIIAVADAYEAMVSDRAYRKGRSHEAAVDEIEKHTGTQFDPKVVSAFLKIQHLI